MDIRACLCSWQAQPAQPLFSLGKHSEFAPSGWQQGVFWMQPPTWCSEWLCWKLMAHPAGGLSWEELQGCAAEGQLWAGPPGLELCC